MRILDCTLDSSAASAAYNYWLQFTPWRPDQFTRLQSTGISLFQTVGPQFSTHALSSLGVLSTPVLWYWLPTEDVPLPGYGNYPYPTATATHSALSILNCILILSGALSNNWLTAVVLALRTKLRSGRNRKHRVTLLLPYYQRCVCLPAG
jgi:hypothetical protein